MNSIIKTGAAAMLITFAMACGSSGNNKNSALKDKQSALKEKNAQVDKLTAEIKKLEADIAKLDPSTVKTEKAKLVATTTLSKNSFVHFIEQQGK